MTDDAAAELSDLRARIDAIDHEMVGLVARRMAVVREIAEFKRGRGLAARDLARERELIGDRRRYAEEAGVAPEAAESLFQVILRASREYLVALGVDERRE